MYVCSCILVLALPYSKNMYVLRCSVHVSHCQGEISTHLSFRVALSSSVLQILPHENSHCI